MKKLIATDFDGTVCRGGKIDPADRAAAAAWRESGRLFGFVTGRGTDFFDTIKELGVEVDFLLIHNGALLALSDRTVVKEYRIAEADFRALEAFFAAIPDVRAYDKADGDAVRRQYYARFDSPERALEAAAEVNRLFGDRVTAFVNGWHVNIGKKGSGKTQGVYDALAWYGLPDDAAAVFGDDYNDLDMIVTHRGWAVDTARPEVLAKAPHVCKSVGEAARELMGAE